MTISTELLAEYQSLTAGSGFVDVSDRTKIELRGDDRAIFLNNFCTKDIKRLPVGESCEAFLCNVKGHVIAYVVVHCSADSLLIDTVARQAERFIAHLDRYLIREKVEIVDRTSDCRAVMLFSHSPPALDEARLIPLAALSCTITWLPLAEYASELSAYFPGLTSCSQAALDIVRIEHGFPFYSADISEENLPQEVDRNSQAISFTKGCYLGQETVARIDALGHVNKTLCGISFAGDMIPTAGSELRSGEKIVGQVTSACWSPKLDRPLALGYVRRGSNSEGTVLQSSFGEATIVSLRV